MTVLASLASLHERLAAEGAAPPFGFSRENVSFCIVLGPTGAVVGVDDLRESVDGTLRPARRLVPRAVRRCGQPLPNFLWDKTAYTLGATGAREAAAKLRAGREHAAFKDLHHRLLDGCGDAGARALLGFLDAWRPGDFGGLPLPEGALDANVAFRLDAGPPLHERPALRRVWLRSLEAGQGAEGVCLATGARAPIARLHSAVKGVAGTQSSGASLISFEKDAFKSFGKERGANAPVSERAAFACAAALNTLLERGSGRRFHLGDTTAVYWAEAPAGGPAAGAAEDLFARLIDPRAEEPAAALEALAAIEANRPPGKAAAGVDEATPLCVLGLAPNAARVSVRFWIRCPIGEIERRVHEHWEDLRLDPPAWRTPPAPWRVLRETALGGKSRNVPPALAGALARAILEGGRYPRPLLAATITRMRKDREVSGRRAAILKACIARDHRLGLEEESVPMGLDENETNQAYRLGRLFALYERLERATAGSGARTVLSGRRFAAASAAPAAVFPLLERDSVRRLARLRRAGKGGLADWFNTLIDAVVDGLDTSLPRSLSLADQGRFTIGYHHQRTAGRDAGAAGPEADPGLHPPGEDE